MEYFETQYTDVKVRGAVFMPKDADASERLGGEVHLIVTVTAPEASAVRQLERLSEGATLAARELGMKPVFKRWLLSDPANQFDLLLEQQQARLDECAWSVVGQPPLDGTRAALFVILEANPTYRKTAPGVWSDDRGRIWVTDIDLALSEKSFKGIDSETLTIDYLQCVSDAISATCQRHVPTLLKMNPSLKESCLRTWFFVRDIDNNYAGVVRGRNRIFAEEGLTADTHFIASTGIGGQSARPHCLVAFNAFADTSVTPGQVRYLYGSTHLNRTSDYGVAFERGTAVSYPDRRHVYISGTASIDNRGQIVAPGDVEAQTERMLENIEVLLKEAEVGWPDVAHMIVYLRDAADYPAVSAIMKKRFPNLPMAIVLAPVCRPGWLVEAECMAISPQ